MAQLFVSGITYDRRDGRRTIRFKIDSELIDKAVIIKTDDEIDAFMENSNFGDYWATHLMSGIIGNDAVAAEWKEKGEFSLEFDEFVFGVGPTKEAAIVLLHNALNNGERDWD